MKPKRYILMSLTFNLSLLAMQQANAQCCYTDNYSSSNGWTMNGSGYTIGSNAFNFNATPADAYNYASHPLNCTLSDTAWTGDIDFQYTGRGTGGVGHSLLAATAGAQDALNTGATFAYSNQDGIQAYIVCPHYGPQSTDSIYAHSKKGNIVNTASAGISVSMNTTYYIRLQRLSPSQGLISVFLDAARTIHAPGSPQSFSVNPTITGLNTIQHGVIAQGAADRTLTGTLANLNICSQNGFSTPTCLFYDDFSSSASWTQVGNTVRVSGGTCNFINTPCTTDQRIYQPVSPSNATLDDNNWSVDIDFNPQNSNFGVSHSILCFTAGNLNPYKYSATGANTNQDFIEILYNSPGNFSPQANHKLYASAKDNAGNPQTSANGIDLPATFTTYYLTLARVGQVARLYAYSDPARTIPLTGSPVAIHFVGSVTGLSTVQIGAVPVASNFKQLSGWVDNICIKSGLKAGGNCDFWDDYSSAAGWNQVGALVSVAGGAATFNLATDGGPERRIWKSTGATFTNSYTWKADFDFMPTSVNGNDPGDILLAMTAGTQDPICGPAPGFPATNQSCIAAYWGSTNHSNNPNTFMLTGTAKIVNGGVTSSIPNILLAVGTQYYITLERLSATEGRISAFTDAARTIPVLNSPQCFNIPVNVVGTSTLYVTGLNTLQHAVVPWGGTDRTLSGTIDNTCIKNYPCDPGVISGPSHFCNSGTPVLTSVSPATGGTWVWTYKWQESTNCTGVWTDIAGANALSCTAPNISTTTCYRRVALGPCGVEIYSNIITIDVYQPLTGNITASSPTGCPPTYVLTANANNNLGVHYLWSTGATTQSITVPDPTTSMNYWVKISNPCYSVTVNYSVGNCFYPHGAFPTMSANSWFLVNWSGGCTGPNCFLEIDDVNFPVGGGPAYNASKMELVVWNRWGQNIFDQVYDNLPECYGFWNGIVRWSGIYQGQPVQQDVYNYYLELTNNCNNQVYRKYGAVWVAGTARMANPDASPDSTAAISSYSNDKENIFPNPSTGRFTLILDEQDQLNGIDIIIIDPLGREVLTRSVKNETKVDFDLSNHNKGIYFVKVKRISSFTMSKIVIE